MAWRAQLVAPLPLSSLLMNLAGVGVVAAAAWLGTVTAETDRTVVICAIALVCTIPALLWTQRTAAERIVLERIDGRA
jgi:hypothetical protein